MPAVPRHGADRLAPGRLGLDRHVPVVRGHAARSSPATTPRPRAASAPLSPPTTPPSESGLDEGPNWARRRLRLARARRWASRMPPFARLLALSITVALAALGAAPAAQAAALPLSARDGRGRRQPARRRRRRRRHAGDHRDDPQQRFGRDAHRADRHAHHRHARRLDRPGQLRLPRHRRRRRRGQHDAAAGHAGSVAAVRDDAALHPDGDQRRRGAPSCPSPSPPGRRGTSRTTPAARP